MSEHTTFRMGASGRITYMFWAITAGGFGSLVIYAHVFTTRSDRTWLEYVFVLLIIALSFFASITCLLKTSQSNPRIEVNETGFTYYGLLETRRVHWTDLLSVDYVQDRGNLRWLKVKVNSGLNESRTFKLDFTGVSPREPAFLSLVRTYAPSANLGLFQRKPGAKLSVTTLKRNPEFEELRRETRQLLDADERDELLAELDRLEESEQAARISRGE